MGCVNNTVGDFADFDYLDLDFDFVEKIALEVYNIYYGRRTEEE